MCEFHDYQDYEELSSSGAGEEINDIPTDGSTLRYLGELFMIHLSRYLRGHGHPRHAVMDAIIPEDRLKVQDDPGFRGRQLLTQATGCELLSISKEVIQVGTLH